MNLHKNNQDAFMRVVISVERKVGSSVVVAMGRQFHETAPLNSFLARLRLIRSALTSTLQSFPGNEK